MALVKQGKTANMNIGASYDGSWYFTSSHTQATGTNGMLVVVIATTASLTLSAPTYNGVTMTQAGSWNAAPGSTQYSVFYLANPTTGANTLRINSNNNGTIALLAQSFTGADTTIQTLHNDLANTPHSRTITIGSNSMIMGIGSSLYSFDSSAAISIDGTGFGFSACDLNGSVSTAQFCVHTRDARLTSGSKTVITDTIADSFQSTNTRIEIKELASASLPTIITTTPITNITTTTANGGGNVTSDGGATVTTRGVCWNTSTNPTTSNSSDVDGSGGTGTFTSDLISLTPNTLYYVRAFAINSVGTAYGDNVTFTTGSSTRRRIFIM